MYTTTTGIGQGSMFQHRSSATKGEKHHSILRGLVVLARRRAGLLLLFLLLVVRQQLRVACLFRQPAFQVAEQAGRVLLEV